MGSSGRGFPHAAQDIDRFVSFVLAAMLAGFLGLIVMGLGSFQNNIAAESAGRILDGHQTFLKENFASHFSDPDSDDYFDLVSDEIQDVTSRQLYRFLNEYPINESGDVLYDESQLIISREDWYDAGFRASLPEINRLLLTQYIFDPDMELIGSSEPGAFRFPGAVVKNLQTDRLTVLIPLLPGPDADGIKRTFNVSSSSSDIFFPVSQDWVAPLVIEKVQNGNGLEFRAILFHPSQPATIQYVGENQPPVEADDGAVADAIGDPPTNYVLTTQPVNSAFATSTSRGKFGLGELALGPVGPVGRDGSPPPIPARKVRPFRMVFESSSLFRMGTRFNPIAVKTEYFNNGNPGLQLVADPGMVHNPTDLAVPPFDDYEEEQDDQALPFNQRVIDRSTGSLQRFIVDDTLRDSMTPRPADDANDFVRHVLRLLPNDDGVWRVNASVELEVSGGGEWKDGHELILRLYRNGEFVRLIDRKTVDTMKLLTPGKSIVLRNDVFITAVSGDVLQVRIFTSKPTDEMYDIQLTGRPETNWVSFERVGN